MTKRFTRISSCRMTLRFFVFLDYANLSENGTFGGRRSPSLFGGRVVGSSDISRILPSCGSNRTFFFKHHRSQDRLGYCAAFSNLLLASSSVPTWHHPNRARRSKQSARRRSQIRRLLHINSPDREFPVLLTTRPGGKTRKNRANARKTKTEKQKAQKHPPNKSTKTPKKTKKHPPKNRAYARN